jgi:hypothetical protein
MSSTEGRLCGKEIGNFKMKNKKCKMIWAGNQGQFAFCASGRQQYTSPQRKQSVD